MPSRYHAVATIRRLAVLQSRLPNGIRFYSNDTKNDRASTMSLHDASPRTIRDFLTSSRAELLDLTLSPYLPTIKPPDPKSNSTLPPGYHFVFFPTSTSELDTLEDGYEKYFAPQHPFKRRLWTQGSLIFENKHENGLRMEQWAECKDELHHITEKRNSTNVWIERTMKNIHDDKSDSRITELRCLQYLYEIPPLESETLSPKNEGNGQLLLVHQFKPSRILLTRFSYLTYNFHRIHIDTEYVKKIELYPDVLVHGSLSIVIILSIVRQLFESKYSEFKINWIKYYMLRPLFVDNPVTISIRTTKTKNNIVATLWDNHHRKAVRCTINSSQIP